MCFVAGPAIYIYIDMHNVPIHPLICSCIIFDSMHVYHLASCSIASLSFNCLTHSPALFRLQVATNLKYTIKATITITTKMAVYIVSNITCAEPNYMHQSRPCVNCQCSPKYVNLPIGKDDVVEAHATEYIEPERY